MMRSLYSGVAGLKTHQTRMDVIGNNIANVNTVGYKSQSVQFSEMLYQTTSSASGPNATTGTGGTNARQIGLGVKTAAISTAITTAGSAQTTNNPFDLLITGDSFFVVNDGTNTYFTRDGSFNVDAAGNLVMASTGYNVMGWQVDPTTNDIKQDTVSALRIMSAANLTYPPEATSKAYVSGIVDKNDTNVNSDSGKTMNLNFYDNRGYSYTAKLSVKATGTDGTYSCELVSLLDSKGNDVTDTYGARLGVSQDVTFASPKSVSVLAGYTYAKDAATITSPVAADGSYEVYTLTDGTPTGVKYKDATDTTGTALSDDEAWSGVAAAFGYDDADEFKALKGDVTDNSTDPATITPYNVANQLMSFLAASEQEDGTYAMNITSRDVMGLTINYSTKDGSFIGLNGSTTTTAVDLSFNGADAANFSTISIDFSQSSNVNNEGTSTVGATSGDTKGIGAGRKLGEMTGVSIQNNGMIYATYDNGQSKLLGQIAAANFANAAGLSKEGDNLYAATQNSGAFDGIGVDITSDGGYMTTGQLEMSNVDLSGELTGMIVTQRGFQANSRIITVSDTMLEELINLKR